jgi:hypothetical protein
MSPKRKHHHRDGLDIFKHTPTQKNSICTSSLHGNSDVADPENHAVFNHILAKKQLFGALHYRLVW